jgi:hypothetical protein
VRYQCPPATVGRVLVAEPYHTLDAWLMNLSVSGAGLLLNRALEEGACILLELEVVGRAAPLELGARVAHCNRHHDGAWVIGCTFTAKLSDDDLEALL